MSGAIIFDSSSTGLANPPVTVARMFTDTYTGMAPRSVVLFVATQLVAGLVAGTTVRLFYPTPIPQSINA